MTDPTPIIGSELEEMKANLLAAPVTINARIRLDMFGHQETLPIVSESDARRINQVLTDLARCIAEIERLKAANQHLRAQAARMYLLAVEAFMNQSTGSCPDATLTKHLPDHLRSLVT